MSPSGAIHELRRLWRALELGAPAGVEAEWRERVGPDLEALGTFLKPEQRLAEAFPCPSPGGEHCPRRVVVHAPEDIVAVCGNSPAECPALQLQRRDLVVYRLNVPAWLREVTAALRERNLLEPLEVHLGDALMPVGLLARRGLRLPVMCMRQPVAAFGEVCAGLRQRLGGDGLVVLDGGAEPDVARLEGGRVAVLGLPADEEWELALWRALDLLDPRYRARRVADPMAIFDDVRVDLATVPGERHVVRIDGHVFGGFQRSDLKFLRFLFLAAARAADPDTEGGGWMDKYRLQGDDKDHDLEALREELRKHAHPTLSEEERGALVKASPARDGRIRLAVAPNHIRFDASLARLVFIGEQQAANKTSKGKRTPGAAALERNLARGQHVAKKLLADARKLGVPAPAGG